MNSEEIKKLLGNPKITFVLGGPASGKGTQCAKLVEEFGYKHLSAGDLLRIEMDKGSREGEKIKKIMAQGALVPQEVTVQLLVNAMIAYPSKNYLIDGFPRSVEQAVYFEQNVMECQTVLFYDVSEELMLERCMGRALNSGRIDDTEEILKKRFATYNQ
jgi:UMP-CMP kinase family protein